MIVLSTATAITRLIGGRNASPFVVFPHSPIGEGTGDAVPTDPNAAPCAASLPDAGIWSNVSVPHRSSRFATMSLRVPPDFVPHYSGIEEGSGEHWDHLLAQWHKPSATPGDPHASSQLAFWIGPVAGYPTVGMPPGTKQLSYRECRTLTNGKTLHMAEFVLREPHQHEVFYSVAVWKIGDGVWIRASASGPSAEVHAQARAIFCSLEIA